MAFDRLDQNGDGWLSLEEIMQQLPDDGSSDAGEVAGARPAGAWRLHGLAGPERQEGGCHKWVAQRLHSGACLPACCGDRRARHGA